MVVEIGMVDVTTVVESAGQLETVGAQLVIVTSVELKTVEVVCLGVLLGGEVIGATELDGGTGTTEDDEGGIGDDAGDDGDSGDTDDEGGGIGTVGEVDGEAGGTLKDDEDGTTEVDGVDEITTEDEMAGVPGDVD